MYPSELREITNYQERESRYRKAVEEKEIRQDSLETRISAGVGLSEEEANSLHALVSNRCRENTKRELRYAISYIPNIRSFGIYIRVLFRNGQAEYCAGQSYPDEIRTVRECLL